MAQNVSRPLHSARLTGREKPPQRRLSLGCGCVCIPVLYAIVICILLVIIRGPSWIFRIDGLCGSTCALCLRHEALAIRALELATVVADIVAITSQLVPVLLFVVIATQYSTIFAHFPIVDFRYCRSEADSLGSTHDFSRGDPGRV